MPPNDDRALSFYKLEIIFLFSWQIHEFPQKKKINNHNYNGYYTQQKMCVAFYRFSVNTYQYNSTQPCCCVPWRRKIPTWLWVQPLLCSWPIIILFGWQRYRARTRVSVNRIYTYVFEPSVNVFPTVIYYLHILSMSVKCSSRFARKLLVQLYTRNTYIIHCHSLC